MFTTLQVSNYGHMMIGIQKLVEIVVKSLHEYTGRVLLMNPWLIMLPGVVACSDKLCKQVATYELDTGMLQSCVSRC